MKKIRKDDQIVVIRGEEKGKKGKVLKVIGEKIIVEKLNIVKKHHRRSEKYQFGGIVDKEAPIHISNVKLISRVTQKPAKVGFKFIEEEGKIKKVRIAKKTGEIL